MMFIVFNGYLIAIVVVIIIFIQHIRKRKLHPPGPLGLPYVGLFPFQIIQILFSNYLPNISQMKLFKQMREKYGEFWSMEMGGQRIITLASYDILNDALVNNGSFFEGRPSNEVFDILSEKQGIILIDGNLFKENRSVLIKAMREMGMGKKELEENVSNETNLVIEYLSKISSQSLDISDNIFKASANIITRLIFNEFNNYGDPLFEKFVKDIHIALMSDVNEKKCGLFPKFFKTSLARYMFPDVDEYFNAWTNLKKFVADKCKKRESIFNEKTEPNCVFELYWLYRYENEVHVDLKRKMNEVSHVFADLYTVGIETTSSFITFCCLMLGRYPAIQTDLRDELQNLSADYRFVNMNMRKNCPKLLSFIDEVHRFCCLVPKFPHRIMKPLMFRGYQLYTDDIVFCDWGTISRDKTLFENPDIFDPYRFMDQSRTKYVSNKYLIPFGNGKRSCIGESIANMEIFLMLSRIIMMFNISLPDDIINNFDQILEGKAGFVHAPLDHKMKLDNLLAV